MSILLPPLPFLERHSRHSHSINKNAVLSHTGLENVTTQQHWNITHPLLRSFSPWVWSEETEMGVMH